MLVCLLLVTLIKMVNLVILQYLLSWPKFPLHNPSILGGKIFCGPYSLFLSLLISFPSKLLLTKQHIYSISILKPIILFPSSHFSLSPNGQEIAKAFGYDAKVMCTNCSCYFIADHILLNFIIIIKF